MLNEFYTKFHAQLRGTIIFFYITLVPDCKPKRVQRQAFSRRDPDYFVKPLYMGKPLNEYFCKQ